MQDPIINEELKNLLPPLSDEEYAGLQASILRDGCLTPLIVWNDTLVDGHYRYEICVKYEIPFAIQSVDFDDLDAAKLWSWKYQEHRRNLTSFHRAEIALKLKDTITAKTKERQRQACVEKAPVPGDPIETRQELSKLAGVSCGTLHMVEHITKHAGESIKECLRNGDKRTSINREYLRLKNDAENNAAQVTPQPKDPSPTKVATFYVGQYSAKFIRDFILALFEKYREPQGNNAAANTAYEIFHDCMAKKAHNKS